MAIKFIDHSEEVKAVIADLAMASLEEAAGELESQVKRNTKVKTGKTKNSWQHRVTKSGEDYVAAVGSNYENAIWEEFGTGEYAYAGNGRKGGWFYKDEKGEGHFTYGKKPMRMLHNAFESKKAAIIRRAEQILKGKME